MPVKKKDPSLKTWPQKQYVAKPHPRASHFPELSQSYPRAIPELSQSYPRVHSALTQPSTPLAPLRRCVGGNRMACSAGGWHVDTLDSEFKAILYLSDVRGEDAPFTIMQVRLIAP